MNKSPIILGIETSCDETAVSIIQDNESGIPKIEYPAKDPSLS